MFFFVFLMPSLICRDRGNLTEEINDNNATHETGDTMKDNNQSSNNAAPDMNCPMEQSSPDGDEYVCGIKVSKAYYV